MLYRSNLQTFCWNISDIFSSHLDKFNKKSWKSCSEKFRKIHRKHLCQILFFNKIAGLRPATLLRKSLWHGCFLVNFVKFLRTPFFLENLWWLFWILLVSENQSFRKSQPATLLKRDSGTGVFPWAPRNF